MSISVNRRSHFLVHFVCQIKDDLLLYAFKSITLKLFENVEIFSGVKQRIADFPGGQQRSRGTHSTEDGASWLKKEKELQISLASSRDLMAGTAQGMAQVGSRKKKMQISWQGQQKG